MRLFKQKHFQDILSSGIILSCTVEDMTSGRADWMLGCRSCFLKRQSCASQGTDTRETKTQIKVRSEDKTQAAFKH